MERGRGRGRASVKKKKKNLIACRGLGRVVGPLLAARALPLRCAASTVLRASVGASGEGEKRVVNAHTA
jgi:hypothetical protein